MRSAVAAAARALAAAAAAAPPPPPRQLPPLLAAAGRPRGFAAAPLPARAGPAPRSGGAAAAPGAPPTAPGGGGGGRRWGALLLAPPALAAFLGVWQLDRRRGKVAAVEARTAGLTAPPVDLFAPGAPAAAALPDHARVRLRGRLDMARAAFVGPRARSAMGETHVGYLVVAPLVRPDGGAAALVVRGWAPAAWRAAAEAEAAAAAERGGGGASTGPLVEVEGVLRASERPGAFVPPNEPAARRWFALDARALAAAAGLPADAPLVEEVVFEREEESGTGTAGSAAGAKRAGARPVQDVMDVLAGRGGGAGGGGGARGSGSSAGGGGGGGVSYPDPKRGADLLTFTVTPQDHANYAATWFALGGATTLLAARALRRGGR
jgi:cytochrome oxidase assembly protein ShyY1